ncbi:MAG: quaternary amine ABC transporter ATP-binding protein [Paracoccaceae bacterium]
MSDLAETEPKVRIRGLYKIFGKAPQKVLPLVTEQGVGKADLLSEHGHVLGLQAIDVDMQDGEITVVMGLSGSGKSTLIRHLNRLIEPTAGEILVDGEDVMTLDETALRHLRQTKMSMVFQKFALLPHRTVLQNAAMALQIRGANLMPNKTVLSNTTLPAETAGHDPGGAAAEGRRWLARVGLEGFEDRYPHQLSGGMQQRVGIARALTSNSDIMLMDEAFSALDPLIRTDMQDLLLELQTELRKTIVFITHDLDEALKLADHLVILKDGAVVQQGEPQEILLAPADPYIEDFVSDINRARVLRVRSVMRKGAPNGGDYAGEVDADDTLESVIARSGGDTTLDYVVTAGGRQVGTLDMRALVRALVPRLSGGDTAMR